MRDLKIQCSCSTQISGEDCHEKPQPSLDRPSSDDNSIDSVPRSECHVPRDERPQASRVPYLMYSEQRKPTRFQIFIQRLFGITREVRAGYGISGHVYSASDNNITYNYGDKRRRRGLRFRRLRRAKKSHSETVLLDTTSPTILNFVQSVQRTCLTDRTPRPCPTIGCKMILFGIINYNDHLNLSHFPERKFVCHYCHEGFEMEQEKYTHENEHLGVNKLKVDAIVSPFTSKQIQKCSITQTEDSKTDFSEEKLKKIVSFFDKIVDADHMLNDLNRKKFSDYNLRSGSVSESGTESEFTSGKRAFSCGNFLNRKLGKSPQSDITSKCQIASVKCHVCGEGFDYRRQLIHHVNLEHGCRDKPSKFHSCAGISDQRRPNNNMVKMNTGKIDVQSLNESSQPSTLSFSPDFSSVVSRKKSDGTLSCDPSTNIVYCPNISSAINKRSVKDPVPDKRSGIPSYHWEPGTKIIRV